MATASGASLIVGLIYFFIFEMLRLRDKLESESVAELETKMKRAKVLKLTVFITFCLTHLALSISLRALQTEAPVLVAENQTLFDVLHIVRGLSRIALDLFMAAKFLQVFSFFVSKKLELLDE